MINFCKAIYYPFVSDKKLSKVNFFRKKFAKERLDLFHEIFAFENQDGPTFQAKKLTRLSKKWKNGTTSSSKNQCFFPKFSKNSI